LKLGGNIELTKREIEEFKETVHALLPGIVTELEDKIVIDAKKFGIQKTWEVEIKHLESILSNLNKMKVHEDSILYDEYSCEFLVRFEMIRPIPVRFFLGEKPIVKRDPANKLIYELSQVSNEYLLFILRNFRKMGMLKESEPLTPFRFRRLAEDKEHTYDLITALGYIFAPYLFTVKIKSQISRNVDEFVKLANAFMYNISYNLDIAIVEVKYLDDLVRSARIRRMRRARTEEIEPPRRKYILDLMYHYQMALSTDSPTLRFISFYHIMEHFFEDVYTEELLSTVKNKLTSPDFSYTRKKDLKELISTITKKLQGKADEFIYNEQEALYLTLKKYVSLESLKSKFLEYDEVLLKYYESDEVPFSKGDTVSWNASNADNIFKKLAARIYKTRNSIVHSKETEKPTYVPFLHDRSLLREIPLMRFIAEEIIVNSSEVVQ
jgi:hypothetical protein